MYIKVKEHLIEEADWCAEIQLVMVLTNENQPMYAGADVTTRPPVLNEDQQAELKDRGNDLIHQLFQDTDPAVFIFPRKG